MECNFYVKINDDILELSANEFINFLIANGFTADNKNINLSNTIKYSLDDEIQQTTDRLKAETIEHKEKVSEIIDRDTEFEDSKFITPQYLIDSDLFHQEGFPHIPQKKDKDFEENMARILMADNMEESEAIEKAKWYIKHWDTIADDAAALHRFIPIAIANLKNEQEFRRKLEEFDNGLLYKKLLGTVTLPDGKEITKIELFLQSLRNAENTTIKYILGEIDSKTKSSSALNVSVDVDIPALNKIMSAHIDRIYIDQNGELYVINYKFSASPYSEWNGIKKEKYKYKMAFIKRALEAKGYNVKGIKMYDIPMYMEYDENGKLQSVRRDPKQESINYIIKNNKAVLLKYENFVKNFIDVPLTVTKTITNSDLESANSILQTILPKTGVYAEGIQMTAEQWIKNYNGICIVPNTDYNSDIAYYVDLRNGNKPVPIKEKTTPIKNKEILDLIRSHTELYEKGVGTVMNHLVKAIKNNYKYKTCKFENGSGFKFNPAYLEKILRPYLEFDDEGNALWELIETPVLHQCGLLLFRNHTTHQLDLIIASPHNVDTQMKLANDNTNLLGMYLYDMNAGHMLKGDYGNIEIIKGLTVLNQIIPNIQGEFNLGNIKVITPNVGGSGRVRTFQQILPYFGKILQFVDTKLENKTQNNLYKQDITDPLTTIIYEWGKIMNNDKVSDIEKQKISDLGFTQLVNIKSTSERIEALRLLTDNIMQKLGNGDNLSIKALQDIANSRIFENKKLAEIYFEAIQYINYLYGNYEFSHDKLTTLERYIMPQYANPDQNVRMVADIYSKALDDTAIEFGKIYKPIRHIIEDFQEKSGYGSMSKVLLGNSIKLYDNLYEKDEKGHNLMRFKNPYTDTTLTSIEREFLKKILFEFAKIKHSRGIYQDFFVKSYSDPKIQDFINNHIIDYFNVPLKRKSSKSENSKPVDTTKYKLGKFRQRVISFKNNPIEALKNWVKEVQDKFEYSENKTISVETLSIRNPYDMSDELKQRATMLNRFGSDYFETDVEQLMADYVEKSIITKKLQEVEFRCRAILTQLNILGNIEGNEKQIQESVKEIEDFLKINMFGQSIMEDFSNKAMLALAPLKSMVSKVYIAGNIRSAFRDTFEGVWQNISRTINHYQTDIDTKSVLNGYKLVIQSIPKSSKGIGIMSELCLRYRLSNTDEARIAEKATNRGGIFDPDSWIYSTLRGPDFLNRMVLFTARCLKDGVWDAFSLNENGDLIYDWRKDGRFFQFAQGNKQHPDYAKQKGLYLSKIRQYNLDHPNADLSYDDNLPEPYSQSEIKAIKQVANSIYGAYDKSQRVKLEHIMLGQNFCMFSTWLNGITANYLRRPGEYSEYTEMKHKIDDAGNYLYFDEHNNVITKINDKFYNENNEEVNPVEANPIYEQVPVLVQGILYTFGKVAKMILTNEQGIKSGWQNVKDQIWTNKYERRNIQKAFYDLLFLMIMGMLFGTVISTGVLEDAYNEFKKDKKKNDVLTNAFVDLLYNSSARSYDGFKGIFALTDYVLNDVEPLAVNANVSLIKDLGKATFGTMQWETLLYKDVPVFRAFKQTHNKLSHLN